MKSFTKEKLYDMINADLRNIDNIPFEQIVHRIYPAELQLNKAYVSYTEVDFLELNLSIHNDTVSKTIHDIDI